MLINMVLPGAAGSAEEPFAFTYSGNYTDNRDADGIGTVRLNTSGTLTVTGSPVTVSVYLRAGGGGAAYNKFSTRSGGGGGGGYQTVDVILEPGTYDIVIGTGGASVNGGSGSAPSVSAKAGGKTSAFGYTCTGGKGGSAGSSGNGGAGGSPNGTAGSAGTAQASGGSPNGGSVPSAANPENGGDGYVELTFI